MRRIALVVFPGFQVLDLVAASIFELANMEARTPVYEILTISEHGGSITSSAGVQVNTLPFGTTVFDTLLVTGAMTPGPVSAGLLAFLRDGLPLARRVASICTGAYILAEAGILDGRRATTHWFHARELQRLFPKIRVEEDRIFINDGPVWTSAGMTACIDLALALVEADIGLEVARAVAKKLVVYHRRAGGQSQFSALLEMEPKSDRIQSALTYAKNNLRNTLSVDELAEVAHLSARQFSRAFTAETGQSPARAVEKLRVETARSFIEDGRHSLDVVADMAGFGDTERMRRAFVRTLGQPPQTVRRVAKLQHAALAA
jgi:transcriptional regulator GlxA family with amidase domain